MFVSKYVLENGGVPLNPFLVFDYFLLDTVNRDTIREGNNNLVKRSDELWVFGEVSNGVLAEIQIAKQLEKPIRFFAIADNFISEIKKDDVVLEAEVSTMKDLL